MRSQRAPIVNCALGRSDTVSVTSSLDREAYDRLDAYCRRHGLLKAEFLRAAILDRLDKNEDRENTQ